MKPATTNRKRRRTNDFLGGSPLQPLPPVSDSAQNLPLSPGPPIRSSPQQSFFEQPQGLNNDTQAFGQNAVSPIFSFSPWAAQLSLAPSMLDTGQGQGQLDNFVSLPQTLDQETPGGVSANGSTHTEGDKDPFMSLLEQLAENENGGGPSDLDFFLGGQS